MKGGVGSGSVFSRIRERLAGNHAGKSFLQLVGGNIFVQAVSLLLSPILTRIYSPADYGVFAVYTSYLTILQIVACLRFEFFITVHKDEEKAYNNLIFCLLLITIFGLILSLLIALCGKPFFVFMRAEELYRYILFLPLSVAVAAAFNALSNWSIRLRNYRRVATANVAQGCSGGGVSIIAGLLLHSPIGLILGSIISQIAGLATLAKSVVESGAAASYRVQRTVLQRLFRENIRGSLMFVGAQLMSIGSLMLPSIILASTYGLQASGHFNLAMRVIGLPGYVFGTSVGQIFSGEAGDAVRNNPAELPAVFRKIRRKCMLLSLAPLGIGAVSPFIFGIIFGAQWREAGIYAAILSLFTAAQIAVSPTSTVMILCQKQRALLLLNIIRFIGVITALVVPYALGCSILQTVGYYSLTLLLVYFLEYIVYARIAYSFGRLSV